MAGLSSETIASIVRRGSVPRPDTLRALADALDGDFDYMMRLAGHLPALPPSHFEELGAEESHQLEELLDLWKAVKERDPDSLGRLMRMARMQAEMVSAALWAKEREAQGEQTLASQYNAS